MHTDTATTIYKLDNTKYQKRKATIEYIFLGIADTPKNQSLRFVHVIFVDEIDEKEADEIWNAVQTDIQAYEIETTDMVRPDSPNLTMKLASKTMTSDLPQEIQDKTNAYARKLFRDMERAGVDIPLDIDRYQFTVSGNPLLSQVRAEYSPIKEGRFTVQFDGSGIAYTKLYSRLADELNLVE